jgi:hypothetical protein
MVKSRRLLAISRKWVKSSRRYSSWLGIILNKLI